MTVDPLESPSKPVDIVIEFKEGVQIRLRFDGKGFGDRLEFFNRLDEIGKEDAIGRIDIIQMSWVTFFI